MDSNLHHGRHFRVLVLAAVLSFGAGSPASSQSLLQAENLLFAPPPGFKVGYESNHDNRLMTEYVPAGESVDDWTQMLTVQIFRGNDALYSVQRAFRSEPSRMELDEAMHFQCGASIARAVLDL